MYKNFYKAINEVKHLFKTEKDFVEQVQNVFNSYTETCRKYHNIVHIDHMLGEMYAFYEDHEVDSKEWHSFSIRKYEIIFAIIYHDIVYDYNKENESCELRSANYFLENVAPCLKKYEWKKEDIKPVQDDIDPKNIHYMICMTDYAKYPNPQELAREYPCNNEEIPYTTEMQIRDACYFIRTLDFCGFAEENIAGLSINSINVVKEAILLNNLSNLYDLNDEDVKKLQLNRLNWLKKIIDKDPTLQNYIGNDTYFQEKYGKKAVENIKKEINYWEEVLADED